MRLSIEVDKTEVDQALDATVRRLARQIRVPGFRPGKVPRRVLEARLGGAGALRQQAISDALPDLYAKAVVDTELDPIAPPEIDITSGDGDGPVTFDAVVEVRPKISVPGYGGLVVTVPSPEVTDEDIDRQVDRLREQTGELSEVSRPARDGDYLSIDLHGSRPAGDDVHVDDYLYELGSGSDVPGLDDQLRGAKPGDILQFSAPDAGSPSGLADASFRVLVKEVKEKALPEATDEWAAEASEFSTLEELRADLRTRLTGLKVLQAQLALRERAVEALIALVEDEPPEVLVDAEVRERLHDLGHRLEGRHMTFEQFLQASGRDEATLLADLRGEAARAVQLDLALRALADAEGLEVAEEELDTTLAEMAQQAGTTAAELRSRLERAGRLPAVRSDRRKAKALAWLLDNVELVDEEGDPVSRDALRADVGNGGEPANTQADQPGERGSEDVGAQEGATVEAQA
jgi:trigger factor